MERFRHIDDCGPPGARGSALCIGNFDGFHAGHRKVAGRCLELAGAMGVPAVVLTFEPHPLEVLDPGRAPRRLTTPDTRARLLEEFGVARLVEHPFDAALASLSPGEFALRFIVEGLGARIVVVGQGFRFGAGRAGDEATLRELGGRHGFELVVVPEHVVDGEVVSSSRVRLALARDADVALAARLLCRPHEVAGVIVKGKGRGRTLGFPTANIESVRELMPAAGIYASEALLEGRRLPAAVHVGPRLTFDGESTVEAYVIGHDHSLDLYGESIRIGFIEHLREVRRFEDRETLVRQIGEDVRRTMEIVQRPGAAEVHA